MPLDKHDDRVRRHAHDLWEKAGKPHGRNDEFWSRAHEEVSILVERETATRTEAYRLWREAGRPLWTADRFWFAAEAACGLTRPQPRQAGNAAA
jgi:hypothetical protein